MNKKLLLLLLFVLSGLPAFAYDFYKDGIYYNIIGTDSVSVTYYSMSYAGYHGHDVVIPSVVEGYNGIKYRVTEIGDYALNGCSNLKSVTIPESVTTIGNSAFQDCSGLTSVTIGNSVTTIGSNAFSGCSELSKVEFASIESLCKINFSDRNSNPLYYAKLYINGQEVKDLVIPDGVTSIKNSVFSGCPWLTSVTIGNSVTSIGEYNQESRVRRTWRLFP